MSLDAHSLEDLARTQSYCHVKMTDVSFEGLQSALKMPHTRIRFANDLPTPPSPAVLGISLISSPGSGFFESALVGLSDNLTCIIGPRGSGKSTIVDALRYAFGYNRTLHELEDDPGLPKAIKARQASNLRDTLIRVYYRLADQTVHVLEATYDPKAEYATRVFTLDGHPVGVDDVEKSGQYPLRLFGWSEIETLGRSPVHQRQLVDRLIPDLASLLEKRSSLRLELKESAQRLLGIAQALSTLFEQDNQVITRFTEYRADFERLNTPEMQRHFASLDLARRKARALQLARQALADQAQKLKDNDPATLLGKIERTLQAAGVDVATWWRETGARALDFDDQFAKAGGAQGQATGLFIALGERLAQLESEAESEGTALEARIREALASDTRAQVAANQRSQAESRLARATKARQDYSAEYDKFEAELKARQEVCRKLAAKQLEISGARNTQRDELVGKLNHFRTDLFAIDLVFKSGGDRIPLSDHLSAAKGFLSNLGVQSRNRKWPELLSRRFNPLQLADALWSKNEALLAVTEEIEGEQRSISAAQAADLIAKRHPVRHHEGADVCLVDRALLQMLLDVEGVPWDDLVQITLNGQSVDNLSPGQRSSAMLPLIALSQSSPLVIDQPEDNLDNRLVGKVVANILAELKEQRQVIVATHNPNIVVAGDAEQVIVLDAVDNKRGKVLEAGSIDHSRIAERVIELLEGGRDAFRIRKERYGF
jgi:energy-coupling factor transporter ATP-binding protein EcfA2